MKGDPMSSKHARLSVLALAVVLGACSPATGGTGSPAPSNIAVSTLTATVVPTPTPTPTPAPTATAEPSAGGGGPAPTPGAIDPCTLLTTDEASTLMGMKLSAGVSEILDPDRVCRFRSGVTEVGLILAPPAPDTATATAYWDAERAQLPAGVTVTDLTLFDRSAYAFGSAAGKSVSALFVIDGQNFFDLFCLFPGCTQGASVTAAYLITGRLP
jgi:hypothetical protein